MGYTAVPTVTTGDIWTAANHNKYLKDNFEAGVPGIFDAKGDMIVATGANAGQKLSVGADGDPLGFNPLLTGGAKWGAAMMTVLTMSADTGFLGNGDAIPWNTEVKDDFVGHSGSGSTISVKGVCLVGANIHYYCDARDGANYPGAGIYNSAGDILVGELTHEYTDFAFSMICIDDFGASDTVCVKSHGGGGSQQFKVYATYSRFWVIGLGAA